MFLIRSAFWLALLVALLPTDEQQQARFTAQATSALLWAQTFCDRNESTCKTGRDTWATMVQKGQFGLEMAGRLVHELAYTEAASPAKVRDHTTHRSLDPPAERTQPTGGLHPDDKIPVWRGSTRTRI